eukprot:scaffold616_cov89-Phaeocystis_antarctica.AAC.10
MPVHIGAHRRAAGQLLPGSPLRAVGAARHRAAAHRGQRTLTLINGCPRRGCQGATTLDAAFAAGRNVSAVACLRVSTNTDADVAAILASPAAAAEARRRLGDMVSLDNLAGCLLRYVLAPSARLARLEATLPHLPPLSAHGLRLGVAAHIRLGDSIRGRLGEHAAPETRGAATAVALAVGGRAAGTSLQARPGTGDALPDARQRLGGQRRLPGLRRDQRRATRRALRDATAGRPAPHPRRLDPPARITGGRRAQQPLDREGGARLVGDRALPRRVTLLGQRPSRATGLHPCGHRRPVPQRERGTVGGGDARTRRWLVGPPLARALHAALEAIAYRIVAQCAAALISPARGRHRGGLRRPGLTTGAREAAAGAGRARLTLVLTLTPTLALTPTLTLALAPTPTPTPRYRRWAC